MSADPSGPTGLSDELDPDEPRTPLWLPLLGLALFLSALVYFLASGDEPAADSAAPPEPAADATGGSAEPE
jgi:hypothetical protein